MIQIVRRYSVRTVAVGHTSREHFSEMKTSIILAADVILHSSHKVPSAEEGDRSSAHRFQMQFYEI